jgi:ribosomal protein S12 methylthiotransferase
VRLARRVGQTLTVLVDGHDGTAAIARSVGDAPEIDGIVRIAGGEQLTTGTFVSVRITATSEHDLAGHLAQ